MGTEHETRIEKLIHTLRGEKVILDSDLASIYGVPTSRFNEAVKRNRERFPPDFHFRIESGELESLTSQIAISKSRRGGRRVLPYAFTEHGAIMAANILKTRRAIDMSIYVIRAFVKLRGEFMRNQEFSRRLAEIERTLIGHDAALRELYAKIRPLLLPPEEPKREEIGFHVRARPRGSK